MNLKNRRARLFSRLPKCNRFSLVHLCPSMLFFPFAAVLLCCSTVVSGYSIKYPHRALAITLIHFLNEMDEQFVNV